MQPVDFIFDGDLNLLKYKVVSIIGYGNQGQAQGLVLRNNGINVIVGNIKDVSLLPVSPMQHHSTCPLRGEGQSW